MEEAKNKKRAFIGLAVIVAIILIAVIMIITLGFNFDLYYQGGTRIEVDIGKKFEIKDIENISQEVLGQETIVQTVEVYEQTVSIMSKDMTEEQRNNIISKINEKYGLELKAEDSELIAVPHTRLRDIIKPYIFPFILATVFVLIYIGIIYVKKTSAEILLETIISVILGQVLLFSIIAITRIPIGILTAPMMLTVYVLSTVFCTARLESYISKHKMEE